MLDYLELPDDERQPDGEEGLQEEVRRLRPSEELVLSGDRLYYEGDFELAAQEFARARRHDPSLFRAWAEETDAYLRAGRVGRANETATEAMDTYGRVPVFYAAKALVLAHQGLIEEAYRHSDVSVRHEEASMFTWLSRAEVVLASNQPGVMRSVDACFENATRHDPTRWRSAFRWGLILLQWGQVDRALEALARCIELAPDNAFAWKLQGDCHRARGEEAAARECYDMALARRPGLEAAQDALRSMSFWGRLHDRLARLFNVRKEK